MIFFCLYKTWVTMLIITTDTSDISLHDYDKTADLIADAAKIP